MEDRLLLDRLAIYDAIARYCRGIDRLDMDLVRSAYHDDGIDHHTGFSGPIGDFIDWIHEPLAAFGGTMHILGTHIVEIEGDVAASETYGTAVHWGDPSDDPRRNFSTGFRYVDHFEQREGRWAIVERWAVREWTRSDAGRYMTKEGDGPSPRRDRSDLMFKLRKKLGIVREG